MCLFDVKHCRMCDMTKSIIDYNADPTRIDGKSYYCRECLNASRRAAYVTKRAANPIARWAYFACKGAAQRASRAAVPFALTAALLVSISPLKCPALGLVLDYTGLANPTKYGTAPNSPTVDRIRPSLGYVPDNVQVLSKLANMIKTNATPQEILAVALFMNPEAQLAHGYTGTPQAS